VLGAQERLTNPPAQLFLPRSCRLWLYYCFVVAGFIVEDAAFVGGEALELGGCPDMFSFIPLP
jgi:hypothetical protein